MFDRFIRLARAKKALHEQRYLDALRQASDSVIATDRRAERIRLKAIDELVARARARLASGDVTTARSEAKLLRQLAPVDAVEQLVLDVDKAAADSQQAREEHQEVRAEFRSLMDAGKLAGAESLLTGLPIGERERADMIGLIGRRRQEAH